MGRFGHLAVPMLVPVADKLVSTGQAARAIGVSQSTLAAWVLQGRIEPHGRTLGGHYRWDIERLKSEIRAMQTREE
jgi:DNA-binding transcriptional MerR regulator